MSVYRCMTSLKIIEHGTAEFGEGSKMETGAYLRGCLAGNLTSLEETELLINQLPDFLDLKNQRVPVSTHKKLYLGQTWPYFMTRI